MGATKQKLLEKQEEYEEQYRRENPNKCIICGEPAPEWDLLCDYHRYQADKDD